MIAIVCESCFPVNNTVRFRVFRETLPVVNDATGKFPGRLQKTLRGCHAVNIVTAIIQDKA